MKIEFESRRQEAMSLKAILSYSKVARLMSISEKAVWMHCTSWCEPRHEILTLSLQDVEDTYGERMRLKQAQEEGLKGLGLLG